MNMINKLSSKNIDPGFIFKHPDAFFGLLALYAANELGIDAGVSVDQIFDFYKDSENSKSPSFPFF